MNKLYIILFKIQLTIEFSLSKYESKYEYLIRR